MSSLSQGDILGASVLETDVVEFTPSASAVSWAAVIAGGVVAASASAVLLVLGSGFGLAMASPWSGASIASFSVAAGIWLIVTQWVASGLGGYLTGRLRTRWAGTHTHEVFFRDTAHGFLTWALATVMAVLLVIAGGLAAASYAPRDTAGPYAYEVDSLLRGGGADNSPSAPFARAEAARILAKEATPARVSDEDRAYLARMVAGRAGLSLPAAENRVDLTIAQIKASEDAARKAGSAAAIFTALAMIIGAFIACVAAALGGQQRDEHP